MVPLLRRRCGAGWIQVIVVVALLAIGIVAVFGVARRTRARDDRVMCAHYLKAIGFAMLLYSNENKGHLPRTLYVPGETVKPVWGTGTSARDPFRPDGPTNDVSAIFFLLARTQDITTEIFICPASDGVRDTYGGGTNSSLGQSNFTDVRRNLTYSIQNPYPSHGAIPSTDKTWWRNPMPARFALASDINPGLGVTNSNNHDGDGQNVLFGDGHVEFLQNPFVGVQRDNIFTNQKGQVVASPVNATDSVLLPTDD
jgi:prepilin-type processing-associated H-X9-DG protein